MCKGLNSWVKKLSQQEMPVVGEVIGELSTLAGSDNADVNQLAEVILRDPNLTTHVLRIANSVHYNYSTYRINTVSRAIVLIGFKGMRAICISSLVIESFLNSGPKERLLELVARAFHAATQARNLIAFQQGDQTEEVFIAALLFHLGEMAFWASDSQCEGSEALLSDDPVARKAAMDAVLGTSFKAITLGLAKQWRLGETLERALSPGPAKDLAVRAVLMGDELSRTALLGWDAPEMQTLTRKIAMFTGQEDQPAREMVQQTAERAVEVARTYGAEAVCRLIPGKTLGPLAGTADAEAVAATIPGDPQLQLNILRELSLAGADITDVNTIMQMVIEGMHRGVGLPRVAIAFIRKQRLQAKYVLGDGTEHWREKFNFDISPEAENLFVSQLKEQSTQWLTATAIKAHPEWHSPMMVEVLGRHEAFVSLLHLGGHSVGIFYADARGFAPLTQEHYDSFSHFAHQAQMNLLLLSQKLSKPAPDAKSLRGGKAIRG